MNQRSYLARVGDTMTQCFNTVILNGKPDESTSGRAYRQGVLEGNRFWLRACWLIDLLFWWDPDHCMMSYILDLERARDRVQYHEERFE